MKRLIGPKFQVFMIGGEIGREVGDGLPVGMPVIDAEPAAHVDMIDDELPGVELLL